MDKKQLDKCLSLHEKIESIISKEDDPEVMIIVLIENIRSLIFSCPIDIMEKVIKQIKRPKEKDV